MRVLLAKCGELVIGCLIDDHMIFDPAHLAFAGLGLEEAPSVLHDFKRLSIGHQGDTVRHRRNPVSQVGLFRYHVDHFRLGMFAQPGTTTQRGHQGDADRGAGKKMQAGATEERQGNRHMRARVSLSALERISHRDASPCSFAAAFPGKKLLGCTDRSNSARHTARYPRQRRFAGNSYGVLQAPKKSACLPIRAFSTPE